MHIDQLKDRQCHITVCLSKTARQIEQSLKNSDDDNHADIPIEGQTVSYISLSV